MHRYHHVVEIIAVHTVHIAWISVHSFTKTSSFESLQLSPPLPIHDSWHIRCDFSLIHWHCSQNSLNHQMNGLLHWERGVGRMRHERDSILKSCQLHKHASPFASHWFFLFGRPASALIITAVVTVIVAINLVFISPIPSFPMKCFTYISFQNSSLGLA